MRLRTGEAIRMRHEVMARQRRRGEMAYGSTRLVFWHSSSNVQILTEPERNTTLWKAAFRDSLSIPSTFNFGSSCYSLPALVLGPIWWQIVQEIIGRGGAPASVSRK